MKKKICFLALFILTILASDVFAERTPMRRVGRVRARGARPSIFVPYVTNGRSAFGVWQGVSPRVYSAPVVRDRQNPGLRPVFNLPFYGSRMSFSGRSNGAVPVPRFVPQPIFR